MLKEKRKRK